MKRTLMVVTLAAALLSGCGTDPSATVDTATSGPNETAPAATTPTTVARAAVTTVVAPRIPVVSTVAPSTTATTVHVAVPAGWKTCKTTAGGYSIAYPGTWQTEAPASTECRYFDPEPVEFEPYSDGYMFALMVGTDNRPFEDARRTVPNSRERVLVHEEVMVGGRRAIRHESEITDERSNVYPQGTRIYGYSVDRAGVAFGVVTYWIPTTQPFAQYEGWKNTVDQAVKTLRFL